ncbi:glycosyltransferase [Prosthecobacter sp.]|uniref:glycosyltransferase n=1 Tax=Prosthecobacter sp. TaxID=1965333 RepID=UPI0025FD534E|nr:glycosyltransferase [Prosthecobacter sp.]
MENMIAQVAMRLPVPEFNVAICALTEADEFKDRLPPGTPVLEMRKKHGLDIGCVLRLRQVIKNLQPDVVHSHNWNALIYSILAIGGGRTGLLHGEHALLYAWERSPWRLRLRRALYTRCDVVHTVSQGQADEMTAFGICGGVELRVIRNGVDTRKFCPGDKTQSRAVLGIPAVGPCIGMVARCVPEKRHELLIEAFKEVAAAFPGATLVLAGAGGMCEPAVSAMIATHPFARRIIWLGHRNDMPAVYNALDLMVLTSTSEGMSNVSLEAMSCGVPVLMNHACGSEELILEGVNGRAAPMRNVHEVAAAITTLLASPEEMQRMGREARAMVELGHPLEKTAADYASVYRQLALRARA